MFRRLPNSLPPDVVRPTTLEEIGYFANEHGQIRKITDSACAYRYKISRDDRVNDVYQGVVSEYIRNLVHDRLTSANLLVRRLPLGASGNEPHVPIYMSRDIEQMSHVLVVFGSKQFEPGIFSYRIIVDEGIDYGTVIPVAENLSESSKEESTNHKPGLVLANPCQLNWYRGQQRAVSDKEWNSLRRESAVHEPFGLDPILNRVTSNRSWDQHVEYMFEKVLSSSLSKNATLDIIAMELVGDSVLTYLATHWLKWQSRINGICLGNPQIDLQTLRKNFNPDQSFCNFMRRRARGYLISDEPCGSQIQAQNTHDGVDFEGFNLVSSGEALVEEGILGKAWENMLEWFKMIAKDPDHNEADQVARGMSDRDLSQDNITVEVWGSDVPALQS